MANTLFFDEQYYLQQNPDVAAAVSRGLIASAAQHYEQNGRFEGRNPNAFFSTSFYLGQYPDVAKAGINPLTHFLNFGVNENRAVNATELASFDADGNGFVNEFNATAYLAANKDVAAAVQSGQLKSAYQHFIEFGQFEGRTATLTNGTVVTGPFTNSGALPGAGATVVLTTGVDALTGTSANETFVGTNTTLNAGDSINGGPGNDTLKIVDATGAASLAGVTVTNVENITVQAASANTTTIDVGTISGVSALTNSNSVSGSTVAFQNVATNATVIDSNTNAAATTTTTFTMKSASDAIKVGFDGTTSGSTITNNSTAATTATTATLTSTGTANGYAADGTTAANTVKFTTGASTLTTVNVNASANLAATLTASDYATAGAALTVSGTAAKVDLGSVGVFKTIDASGLSNGGLTISTGTTLTSFVGGQGSDSVTIAAQPTSSTATISTGAGNDTVTVAGGVVLTGTTGSINGGDGTDTLAFSTGSSLTSDTAKLFTGFEVLQVSNAGAAGTTQTYDTSLLPSLSLKVGASTGAVALTNVAANPTVTVAGNVAGTAGLAVTLKDATGTADSVTINLDNGATNASANNSGFTVSKLTVAGVETLNLNANGLISGTGTAHTITNDATANTALTKVVIGGSQAISFTTGAIATALTVDGSAATGVQTINGAAANAALNINGGSANDTITAGTAGGTISGGLGGDAITLGNGVDKIVFKGATDSLQDFTNGATKTTMDSITGFTSGADKLDLSSLNFTTNTTKSFVDKTFATTAALVTAEGTAAFFQDSTNITRGAVAAHIGGDTYLVVDANHDGVFNAASDMVVKLTGTATIAQGDVVFG